MEVQAVVELDLVMELEQMLEVVVILLLRIRHKVMMEDLITSEVAVAVEEPQLLEQEEVLVTTQQELAVMEHLMTLQVQLHMLEVAVELLLTILLVQGALVVEELEVDLIQMETLEQLILVAVVVEHQDNVM